MDDRQTNFLHSVKLCVIEFHRKLILSCSAVIYHQYSTYLNIEEIFRTKCGRNIKHKRLSYLHGVCLILVTLTLKPHFKFLNPWAPTKYDFNQLISSFWRNIHFSSFVMASSSWLIRFEIVSHWESYSCRVSRSIYKRLPWHYTDVMSNWNS